MSITKWINIKKEWGSFSFKEDVLALEWKWLRTEPWLIHSLSLWSLANHFLYEWFHHPQYMDNYHVWILQIMWLPMYLMSSFEKYKYFLCNWWFSLYFNRKYFKYRTSKLQIFWEPSYFSNIIVFYLFSSIQPSNKF